MSTLSTEELREGDWVELVRGRDLHIGRRYIVGCRVGNGGPNLSLTPATKVGKADRRHIGWSGWYGDCRWVLINRANHPFNGTERDK